MMVISNLWALIIIIFYIHELIMKSVADLNTEKIFVSINMPVCAITFSGMYKLIIDLFM